MLAGGNKIVQTQDEWVQVLKTLRERDESILHGIVSNLQIIFTHDTITLVAPNRGVAEILEKNRAALASDKIKIRLREKPEKNITLEQKLANLFGDKYTVS